MVTWHGWWGLEIVRKSGWNFAKKCKVGNDWPTDVYTLFGILATKIVIFCNKIITVLQGYILD